MGVHYLWFASKIAEKSSIGLSLQGICDNDTFTVYISIGLYLPYIEGLLAMTNVMGNFGTHAWQHVAINYRDSG